MATFQSGDLVAYQRDNGACVTGVYGKDANETFAWVDVSYEEKPVLIEQSRLALIPVNPEASNRAAAINELTNRINALVSERAILKSQR